MDILLRLRMMQMNEIWHTIIEIVVTRTATHKRNVSRVNKMFMNISLSSEFSKKPTSYNQF